MEHLAGRDGIGGRGEAGGFRRTDEKVSRNATVRGPLNTLGFRVYPLKPGTKALQRLRV